MLQIFSPGVVLGRRGLGFEVPPTAKAMGLDEPGLNPETSVERFHKGGAEVLLSTIYLQKWRFMNGRAEAVCKKHKRLNLPCIYILQLRTEWDQKRSQMELLFSLPFISVLLNLTLSFIFALCTAQFPSLNKLQVLKRIVQVCLVNSLLDFLFHSIISVHRNRCVTF